MVDSVSYLPTELTGAALQMGQYYKLHHIKPSSAYSPDVLCSQKYSFPTVSKRGAGAGMQSSLLVCIACRWVARPSPRQHSHLSKSHRSSLMTGLWSLGSAMLGRVGETVGRIQHVPHGLSYLRRLRLT